MGRKRVKTDSNFQSKKCAKRSCGDDDRISRLPDDILSLILSSLAPKEAGRTSILSSRWVNLWKHTSCLNFDDDKALDKIANHSLFDEDNKYAKQRKLREKERCKFVKWVNCVLQTHKSLTLKEFRICFDLSKSNRKAITRWLEYAFSRQVQCLELDLSEYDFWGYCDTFFIYVFPEDLLTRSSFDFKFLKALSFICVNVTGEAIEFFFRNCPLLEQLKVRNTEKISNLEVCGPSLKLKHLEMCICFDLETLKVSAPKLTSLRVTSLKGLLLENVPMLVDVSVIVDEFDCTVQQLVCALSSCISQLEILSLKLVSQKEILELCKIPQLPKLKTLEIEYWRSDGESLIGLIDLIRASPCLEEFVLRLEWPESEPKSSTSDRQVKDALSFPSQHLKVVKFCGYYGCTSDVELVRHILENCVVLEKIIVDPRNKISSRAPLSSEKLEMEQTAKNNVKQQLDAQVPKHIELIIV